MEDGRVNEYAEDGELDDLFDHIDDLLEFPNDGDLLSIGMGMGMGMAEQLIPFSPLPLPLHCHNNDVDDVDVGGLLNCNNDNSGSSNLLFDDTNAIVSATNSHEEELCNSENKLEQQQQQIEELDIISLEWMSQFLEESESVSLSIPSQFHDSKVKEDCFRTASPVSVLQQSNNNQFISTNHTKSLSSATSSSSSSSSSSSASSFPYCNSTNYSTIQEEEEEEEAADPVVSTQIISAVPGRTRTKRTRPTGLSPHPHITIPVPVKWDQTNSTITPTSDPESIGESHPAPMRKKSRVINKKLSGESCMMYGSDADDDYTADGNQAATNVRKCQHCQITKTPQWRAGPMGPKTLCNACGVRYKSGRLFPEYRPAASPTFVPSIHSNSHKKVVEMRNKTSNTASTCDLLNYIRKSQKMSRITQQV